MFKQYSPPFVWLIVLFSSLKCLISPKPQEVKQAEATTTLFQLGSVGTKILCKIYLGAVEVPDHFYMLGGCHSSPSVVPGVFHSSLISCNMCESGITRLFFGFRAVKIMTEELASESVLDRLEKMVDKTLGI